MIATSDNNITVTLEILKRKIAIAGNLPHHIAITMDGNGRWAKKQGKPRMEGHKRGAEVARDIIDICDELGIKVLTLYAFSFENWQRPQYEISFLLERLMPLAINRNRERIKATDIQVRVMGELDYLPPNTYKIVHDLMAETKNNNGMVVNFAISYSGRLEILNAVQKLFSTIEDGSIRKEDIDEHLFSQYLYTAGLPDPELHIRCGGVNRISNLMLWQMAYTELIAPGTLWPDFTSEALCEMILHYQTQPRKFGRIPLEDQ